MNKRIKAFLFLELLTCVICSAEGSDESCPQKSYQDACIECYKLCKADSKITQDTCDERMRGCCADKHFTKCSLNSTSPVQKPTKKSYTPVPPPVALYGQNQILPLSPLIMRPGLFSAPGLVGLPPFGQTPYNQMPMTPSYNQYNQMPQLNSMGIGPYSQPYNQTPMLNSMGMMPSYNQPYNQMPMMMPFNQTPVMSPQFPNASQPMLLPSVGAVAKIQPPSIGQQILDAFN